jgi:hypothetical protein
MGSIGCQWHLILSISNLDAKEQKYNSSSEISSGALIVGQDAILSYKK